MMTLQATPAAWIRRRIGSRGAQQPRVPREARRQGRGGATGLGVALLLGITGQGLPAQVPAVPRPLDDAVTRVLEHNTALRQERLLEDRAGAALREARGRFLPSLGLDFRYSRVDGGIDLGEAVGPAYRALNQLLGEERFPSSVDLSLPLRHESRLRLVQPVFQPVLGAARAAAGAGEEAQRSRRRSEERRLAAEAQVALLEASVAAHARQILDATLPLLVENERVTRRRLEEGLVTPDAVLRAEAERADVEQALSEAREREGAAARAFNRLVGLPLDTPVEPLDEEQLPSGPLPGVHEAEASALAGREELQVVGAGVAAADAGARMVAAAFLPSVSLALDYTLQGQELRLDRDDEAWAASVVVSWSLFNGGQDRARLQGARSEAARVRVQLQEVEELIRLDVRQAHEAAVVAMAARAPAEARLAAARRGFELVRRRSEEGLATPLEFLDARSTLTSAELNRTITLHREAVRRVELERAAALRSLPDDR
jgi:outer membrane protein TolC